VAVDTTVGYLGSDVVNPTSSAALPTGVTSVKGLSDMDAGLSLTYMGASVFGHVTTGTSNGGPMGTRVQLASGRKKNALAWVVGTQYASGPYTVGTSWYQYDSQGANAGTGNRQERGFALGGQYTVVTGFDVFLEYLWSSRKQAGFNFVDGSAGAATSNNKITTSAVLLTGLWRW